MSALNNKNWTNIPPYLEKCAREKASYYYSHIGSRIRAFHNLMGTEIGNLESIMAVSLRYFTEFGSFEGQLRHCATQTKESIIICFSEMYALWRQCHRLPRNNALR